jgi:hypothetical protein
MTGTCKLHVYVLAHVSSVGLGLGCISFPTIVFVSSNTATNHRCDHVRGFVYASVLYSVVYVTIRAPYCLYALVRTSILVGFECDQLQVPTSNVSMC